MTQDEIIRMAREAGCYEKYEVCYFVREDLERFAALVAAHEREKQAEQEPVAWGCRFQDGSIHDCICPESHAECEGDYNIPLYAAPVRTKDLTDDEIRFWIGRFPFLLNEESEKWVIGFARVIIAADREKNK